MTEKRLKITRRIAIQSASLLFALLVLLWMPFFYLYGRAVCLMAWFFWVSPTRNVVVVLNRKAELEQAVSSLLQTLSTRAVFLDYSDRQQWALSIPTQLFLCFGPQAVTDFRTQGYLPTVIVVNKFRNPASFSLGQLARNRENNLSRLQTELGTGAL